MSPSSYSKNYWQRHAKTSKSFAAAQTFFRLLAASKKILEYTNKPPRTWKDRREYVALHRELYRQAAREYYYRNKDQVLATSRAWKEKNPERVKELHKRWVEQNREQKNLTNRAWRENNPKKVKEQRLKYNTAHKAQRRAQAAAWRAANRDRHRAYSRGHSRGLRGQDLKDYVTAQLAPLPTPPTHHTHP